ncbi:MAG: hypothetical protein DRP11_00165, partial [Candidatus Aenigmatarchaeota archaeon]
QLYNISDYLMEGPYQSILPDGTPADIYAYNFSYNFTNWDGYLYDNDTIVVEYNATVLGGGEWVLPAIISAFDPSYLREIKTEMYPSANVPSFDVFVEILTDEVEPGEVVKALLRIVNVGGPRAKVDVFVNYAIKETDGTLITERSETIAVVEQKEKLLELAVPEDLKSGLYIFETFVSYTQREALSTDTFRVVSKEKEDNLILFALMVMIALLLGMVLLLYSKVRRIEKGNNSGNGNKMVALIIHFCLLFTPTSLASLNLDVSLSQKSYRPGDSLGVLVTMNDPDYNGMKRDVLVSVEGESGIIAEKTATLSVGESRSKLIELNYAGYLIILVLIGILLILALLRTLHILLPGKSNPGGFQPISAGEKGQTAPSEPETQADSSSISQGRKGSIPHITSLREIMLLNRRTESDGLPPPNR